VHPQDRDLDFVQSDAGLQHGDRVVELEICLQRESADVRDVIGEQVIE
jgi:hypothetical protein